MDVWFLAQAYDSYGGDRTLSLIGSALHRHRSAPADLLSDFEVTAHFRSQRAPRKTLDSLYAKHHSNLARLPQVRWAAKRGKLSISYESHLGSAEEILHTFRVTLPTYAAAFREFVVLIEQLEPVLRKKKGLDYARLVQWVVAAERDAPKTEEELIQFEVLEKKLRAEEIEALSPWERLGIDWGDFHRTARDILDDPFFWEGANDYAPNGNDTGADLLAILRENRGIPSSPVGFLNSLLSNWGMKEMVEVALAKDFASTTDEDEMAITTFDEAAIALPFAFIKLYGECPQDAASLGIEAVARERSFAEAKSWQIPDERATALEKIKDKLEAIRSA